MGLCALCSACPAPHDSTQFAAAVTAFHPGEGAGYGADAFPQVVLGPPVPPEAERTGSLDVLSLGAGGSIVLKMGAPIVDGAGPDFVVFENPFVIASGGVFAEPGEVAVSADGETFAAFACDPAEDPSGCAGETPTAVAVGGGAAADPLALGGDAFDLAALGLAEAMYVRITDRGTNTAAPAAGFDLDAVAAVNSR